MNIRKRVVVFFIAFFALTLLNYQAGWAADASGYDMISEKVNVEPDKVWTIRFNQELKQETVNIENIMVLDKSSKNVDINVAVGTDKKSIIVAPEIPYSYGETYTLYIKNGVKGIAGQLFKKPVKMQFTIKAQSQPSGEGAFKVVLDAAYGGYDSGHIGPSGITEKDVVLPVVLQAGKILEQNGIQVIYTRKSDEVTWNKDNDLNTRFQISDDADADFFISVHVNVAASTAKGYETYYQDGVSAGKNMAANIQGGIAVATGLTDRNRGAKANTNTMPEVMSTEAPGVKVYLGFISNPDEEKMLNDSSWQQKYAQGIANAVLKYKAAQANTGQSGSGQSSGGQSGAGTPEDIQVSINQGDDYTLPKTVKVRMDDGTKKDSSVTWNNSTVDTDKLGVMIFEGTVKDCSRKVYASVAVTPVNSNNAYTIMLDAGHGGYDTGAVGPNGINEKNVTLPVALKAGDLLAKQGVKVVFTRISDNVVWPSDESLDLQKRVALSDAANTTYFVAIHANSVDGLPNVGGIETYYREGNDKGAALASAVQTELVNAVKLNNRKTKTAHYYVLMYPKAPAILAELAFISNPTEEALLNSADFQTKCATAIVKGVLSVLGK